MTESSEHPERACVVIFGRDPGRARERPSRLQKRPRGQHPPGAFGKQREIYSEPEMALYPVGAKRSRALARAYACGMQLLLCGLLIGLLSQKKERPRQPPL